MTKTRVSKHSRKGTKGVKSHDRTVSRTKEMVPNVFTAEERKQIAETIRRQIGRNTLMYVGAHDYIYGEEEGKPYLQFKASGTKIQRGGRIRVLYDYGHDLYNVELWRVNMRAKEPVKKLKSIEGVQASQLREIIEDYTG